MYSSFAKKLFEATDSQTAADEITEFVNKLRTKLPSLDEFTVAFREVVYTNSNSKQKNLVRYILRNFSEYYSYKYQDDFDDLTIEHLYPQSKIDDDKWTEKVVGCLGNLIYLEQEMNGKVDSKKFFDKKDALLKADCALPDFIKKSQKWEPSDVKKHTELMAETAYNEIWKI